MAISEYDKYLAEVQEGAPEVEVILGVTKEEENWLREATKKVIIVKPEQEEEKK